MEITEELVIDENSNDVKPTSVPTPTVVPKKAVTEFTQPSFDPEKLNDTPGDDSKRKILTKEEYEKGIFTIKEVKPTNLKLKDADGNPIPPSTNEGKTSKWFDARLKIVFEEDLMETYPKLKYWVNDGKVADNPSIKKEVEIDKIAEKELDHYTSTVDLIYAKFARFLGKDSTKDLTDKEFFTKMVGCKVKLKLTQWTYNKTTHYRNDIIDFVKV